MGSFACKTPIDLWGKHAVLTFSSMTCLSVDRASTSASFNVMSFLKIHRRQEMGQQQTLPVNPVKREEHAKILALL